MEVSFEWAAFIREFDRQSAVEGGKSPKSPPGAAGPSSEPCGEKEAVCGCFDHVGKGECHAHQCPTCRFGCHHEAETSRNDAEIVPICEERASPPKTLKIRLNGSKSSIVCHDEQIATTSNGVSDQTQTQTINVKKSRTKRPREPEPSTSNGNVFNGDVEYVECASRRKPRNTQQTEIDIDSRKTKTLNGRGNAKGIVSEETQTIDLANLDEIPVVDAKTYGKKTKGRQNKAKQTTEIGVYDHMEEEISSIGSPRRNGKKRPAKKPISPRMDHKRSQMLAEEDAFRFSEEADVFKYSLTNGTGPSTSSPPPKSSLKSPSFRRNGYTLFNGDKHNEESNHVDPLEKPTPTTSAEAFFQGAFHTKERWRRSSDTGGDGQCFEPVSLTSPAQSLLSPRNRVPIDPLMSPLGEEAEQPKQNGKLNGQRSLFRNAKNPGRAKKPTIVPFQSLVRGNRRESVCSDTLLTPPLPNDEEPTQNGTHASILGPLALRPPDTFGFEGINPDLISPSLNLISPLTSPGGNWPANAPMRCSTPLSMDELSVVIPEKKTVTLASPEKRESLLIPLQTTPRPNRTSPRKNSVATLFSPNKTMDAEGNLHWVSETEIMPHLDQSGLPCIDDLMDFAGMEADDLNTTMSKPAIPRLVVTPLDNMLTVLKRAVRSKLNKMADSASTKTKDLKEILPPLYAHTKVIHEQLKRNWKQRKAERLEYAVDWITGKGGKEYKRPMIPFWKMEQNDLRYQRNSPTAFVLPEDFVGKECLGDHHSEKEFLNRMEMQMELITARKALRKQKSNWEKRNVMYLEQQLPHVSTDKEKHEEEAKREFKDLPDDLRKAKDGPYWLPSVKIHEMVTTAIRSRVVVNKNEDVDITFLLKDWNELRISYKSDFRLPKEVLVTLSPFREIAPVIQKRPDGRFKTQLLGQVKLP